MNQIVYVLSLGLFLLLPPTVLLARATWGRQIQGWLGWVSCLLGIAVFGWVLVNITVHFYYFHLDDLIETYGSHPPKELVKEWTADGAKKVFALLFGWLYALVYFSPWLIIYMIVQGLRRWLKNHRANRITARPDHSR